MRDFGERIRKLRKEKGLTIYELALKLGISRNTLTMWERGEKEPYAIEVIRELANVLEVPMINLLAGENKIELENNPVIKNLNERLSRLERIFSNYME